MILNDASLKHSPHWIDFYVCGTVRGIQVSETIRFRFAEPVELYDETAGGLYCMARARALRTAKRRAGLHSCTSNKLLHVDPHDWSDSIHALVERISAEQRATLAA